MVTTPSLSIVIPTYNDEGILHRTMRELDLFVQTTNFPVEIIFVDDGSTDSSRAILGEYSKSKSFLKVIHNDKNRGKGFAVRNGIMASTGENVLFTDSDLPYSLDKVDLFVEALKNGSDIAIGSRFHPDSRYLTHPRHIRYIYKRHIIGRVFIFLVRLLLGFTTPDTQCGFKAFRGEIARDLFARSRCARFSFDVEILYIAKLRNYKIEEMPVTYFYRGELSSVRGLYDSIKMLLSIIQIKRRGKKGEYLD